MKLNTLLICCDEFSIESARRVGSVGREYLCNACSQVPGGCLWPAAQTQIGRLPTFGFTKVGHLGHPTAMSPRRNVGGDTVCLIAGRFGVDARHALQLSSLSFFVQSYDEHKTG